MGIFRSLFSKYKYLIYTAFGSRNYSEAAYKLKQHEIPFETVIIRNQNAGGNFSNHLSNTELTQYDIYVRKEDQQNAQSVIHKQ